MSMNQIINNPSTTIIDVRTEQEFSDGSVAGSVNIPLHTIPDHVDRIRDMSKPLVLCCESGGRSSQAMMFLQNQGIDQMHNGGGWAEVQLHKS